MDVGPPVWRWTSPLVTSAIMRPQRFKLALELLEPEQWARFETLASAFLVPEFPDLRTVAGVGDRGRDAELFQPAGDETVLLQYSVAEDWAGKVNATVRKIRAEDGFPKARDLIYVTNQRIGASADDLKGAIRKDSGLVLDVRDQTWFVDRFALDAQRSAAAEAFAADVVDPYLAAEGVIDAKAPALSDHEARAALVYLSLQWSDDSRSKGLTKVCFDALVRAVLRDSDSEHRVERAEVRKRVAAIVKGTQRERVDTYTDSALARLSGKAIRHWKQADEFCLSSAERARITDALEDVELQGRELEDALVWEVALTAEALGMRPPSNVRRLAECVRTSIETILLRQGESFASAVESDGAVAAPPDLAGTVANAMEAHDCDPADHGGQAGELVERTTRAVLAAPAEPVQRHFRTVANAYTLFAFLRETPDVQSAVKKMFSVGDIWLDTSVLLPLFGEKLVDDPAHRRYTGMFRAAREAGLNLHVIPGVLEELSKHMDRALACSRATDPWVGRVPFLLVAFTLAGEDPAAFPRWIEEFRGTRRPEADIAQYLHEEHGITVESLERDADRAGIELRGAVQEVWHSAHERRRGSGPSALDSTTLARLVSHDVENYVGVVMRRKRQTDSAFGYRAWWLTLDRTAFALRAKLRSDLGGDAPDSPVMSPDFMVTYLALGPLRGSIRKADEVELPLPTSEFTIVETFSDLLEEAKRIREEMAGQSDRIVRRAVRDRLDEFRRREGVEARGGVVAMEDTLKQKLASASGAT